MTDEADYWDDLGPMEPEPELCGRESFCKSAYVTPHPCTKPRGHVGEHDFGQLKWFLGETDTSTTDIGFYTFRST